MGGPKEGALEGEAEVCGYCKIGIGMRKGDEWWDDSVVKVVQENKKNALGMTVETEWNVVGEV